MQKMDQDFSVPLNFQRQHKLGGETLTVLNLSLKLSLKTSISNALFFLTLCSTDLGIKGV